MNLNELKLGQRAVIEELCDKVAAIKLLEMGCLPGEQILMKLKAPFNDPIAIEIDGNIISLRKAEAGQIRVKLITV